MIYQNLRDEAKAALTENLAPLNKYPREEKKRNQ